MTPHEHDLSAAIRQNLAILAIELNLLAAKSDKTLAAFRTANLQVKRGGIVDIRFVGKDEMRALFVEDDCLHLIGEQGFEFLVAFAGGGELVVLHGQSGARSRIS